MATTAAWIPHGIRAAGCGISGISMSGMTPSGQTASQQTLLVKSKTRGKAVLDTTFGDRGDRKIPVVTLTPAALKMDHRDLTNRVTTTFTPVRTEADRPGMSW